MRTAIITYSTIGNDNGTPVFRAAGNRLRLVPAYNALLKQGANPVIFGGAEETDILSNEKFRSAQQVLFGKLVEPMPRLMDWCRGEGKRVIFDICDDPWDYPELGPVRAAAAEADFCTTSSEGLAEKLRTRLGVPVRVINEPPDCGYGTPRVQPSAKCVRLLWFGSDTNADSLQGIAEALRALAAERDVELTLVGGRREPYEFLLSAAGGGLSVEFSEWGHGVLDQALERADVVLIPKRAGPWSELKSENRLVTALAAGRIAVAGAIGSYEKLSEWCVITQDILGGLRDILEHPGRYLGKVRAGQAFVRETYDREVIERRWLEVLT